MIATWIKFFFSRLTLCQMQSCGSILGQLLYLVLADRRRIAWRNLRLVYPHWSTERVHRFSREVFRHFGMTLMETLQMYCLTRAQCRHRIDVEGAANLNEALQEDRGTIIISAHLGNWETALQFYPLFFGKPMVAVVKPFRLQVFDRLVDRAEN